MEFDRHTLDVLEWSQIQQELSASCASDLGKEWVDQLFPGKVEKEQSRHHAQAILELIEFKSESDLSLPIKDVSDVRDVLRRIERSGSISLEEFSELVSFHKAVQGLHHFLRRYPKEQKCLQDELHGLELLHEWAEAHFGLLDSGGNLVDDATSDLKALRQLAQDLRDGIEKRLNDFLNNPRYAELMQDFYITVRQGRYVVPIRSNFKGRVPGIIHDLSKTEQTLFIEPEDVVEMNNKLKVAEKEIELEIERILIEVVQKTQAAIPAFQKNKKILAKADFLEAAAALIGRIDGPMSIPEWKESNFELQELRHPLLSLREPMVANDIDWERGLVLTGPNTGGKTVMLKAVGLGVCFAHCGLPVPAKTAVFPQTLDSLFVDIGDEQDLEQDLSTFSAHVSILKRFSDNASKSSLIMIDEIATATAPEEGECLAQAYLESLLDSGAMFFVTTHYGRVKNFAMADDRCRIAAMGFSQSAQKPNYEIVLDIPGESSALATASNMGLAQNIVERAKFLIGEPEESTQKAVERLEKAREDARAKKKELESELASLKLKQKQADDEKKRFESRLKSEIDGEAQKFLKDFSELKSELSAKLKEMTPEELAKKSQQLFSQISEAGAKLRENVSSLDESENVSTQIAPLALDELENEMWVEISGLGMGRLIEVPQVKIQPNTLLMVQVGELRTRVSASRLRKPSQGRVAHVERQEKMVLDAERRRKKVQLEPVDDAATSKRCDVRGKNVEDALVKVEDAIAMLLRENSGSVTIIHGHGGEKLKLRIREYLRSERVDLKFRPGSLPGEGGDGVTVVELAEDF